MEMINNLRDTIRGYIYRQEIAGVSVLVQKKGEEICFLAEGMSDIENGRKIERDTIYRLYSQTKPVTAAAVMILVERGILDLCQPVSDFLPGFKNQKVLENGVLRPVHREAALFDLMQMTAGSTYTDTTEVGKLTGRLFDEVEKRLYGNHPMTTVEFANAVGELPLAFDPGSSWNYGLSADILGAVVEIASGMRLGDFMQKEIFEPLGMKDTAFWVPEEKQYRLAKSYDVIEDENGKHLIPYTGNEDGIQNRMERRPAYESGGAGLASTLDDYMRFARMLLNGWTYGDKRILRSQTVRFLTSGRLLGHQQPVFVEKFGLPGFSYGNLMRVCKDPEQSSMLTRAGEYGWDGWLGVYFANFPAEDMTILFGMQRKAIGMWPLTRKMRNIILSSL